MKTQVQLILATIGLTVLIWVYADLTSQEAYQVTVTVRLSVPVASDSVICLKNAPAETDTGFDTSATVPVEATVVGPKAALADLEHLRRSEGLVVEVPVATSGTSDPNVVQQVDIRGYVVRWARERSLRIVDLSRSFVEYRLNHYVKIDLTVEVTAGSQAEKLKGIPRVDPPQVKARLLAGHLDRLAASGRKLEVSIEPELRAGTENTFDKSLAGLRWHGLDVTYTPNRVKITVQRREDVKTVRITSIPMCEMWPAYRPEQGQFRVEWEDGEAPLQHIEVEVPAGPSRLPTNKDVFAYVSIEPDDLKQAARDGKLAETMPAGTRAGVPRPVRFIFTDEFKDARITSPAPAVRFHVVRVDTPASAP